MTAGRSGRARAAPPHTTRERLAGWLDQAAFVALTLLALSFAFEWIRPVVVLRGGLALTSVELVLLTGLGLWVAARAAGWRRPQSPPGLALPALLWLIALTMSSLLAPDHRVDALKFTARTASGLLAGWAAYDLVASSRQPGRRWLILLRSLAVTGGVVTLFGVAEVAQWAPALHWLAGFKKTSTLVGDLLRVSATLGYATVAAMVLELTLPLLLVWLVTTRSTWLRVVLAITAVTQLAVLVLTLTRGGVLALLAGLGVMAWLAWHRRLRPAMIGSVAAGGVLLALVGLLLFINPTTALRLKSESDTLWYQATYQAPPSIRAEQGAVVTVPIQVSNTGVRPWTSAGERPFVLAYHLRDASGQLLSGSSPRTFLPQPVAPGQSTLLRAQLQAPARPGEYQVEWEMVQEGVTWFSSKGSQPGLSRLVVAPGANRDPSLGQLAPAKADPRMRLPAMGRLQLWSAALEIFRHRPLFGVGPDNFRLVYGSYVGLRVWEKVLHANNVYLEWLADTGLVGLLVFIWLNGCILLGALHKLGRHNPSGLAAVYDSWQLGLIAALTAWFVHGLLDSFYEFTPTFVAFWLIAGLALAMPTLSDSNHHATGI